MAQKWNQFYRRRWFYLHSWINNWRPTSNSWRWRKIFVGGDKQVRIRGFDSQVTFDCFISLYKNIFRIVVHYGARITHAPTSLFADEGEHVVLECQADGYPRRPGMVKWTKGKHYLLNNYNRCFRRNDTWLGGSGRQARSFENQCVKREQWRLCLCSGQWNWTGSFSIV